MMKKLNLLYALLFAVAIVSCKDDEEPAFKKADLIGEWTMTASTVDNSDCGTYSEELDIDDSTITQYSTCDNSDYSVEMDYTFDNKKTLTITVFGITGKFVITQLSSTTLKGDWYYQDTKTGSSTYSKQ